MNRAIVTGNWQQSMSKLKAQRDKLTGDHLSVIAGQRVELADNIQAAYGITKDEAEQQIKRFEERNKEPSEEFLLT